MRFPQFFEKPQTDAGFNAANELGHDAAAALDKERAGNIQALSNNPYLHAGHLAAGHLVVYGENGFDQWSEQAAIKASLQGKLVGLERHADADSPIPGWVLSLYTPAAMSSAVLFGQQPNEVQQEVMRKPLHTSLRERFERARYSRGDKAPFAWSYAAVELANIRVLLGEEEFNTALSELTGMTNTSVEDVKAGFSGQMRKYIKELSKNERPGSVIGTLADLRIIEAAEVEIVEREGLRIVDIAVGPVEADVVADEEPAGGPASPTEMAGKLATSES